MTRVSGDRDGSPGGRLDGADAVADEQVALTVELEDRGGGERVGVAARVGQREPQGGHRVAPVHGQGADGRSLDEQGCPLGDLPRGEPRSGGELDGWGGRCGERNRAGADEQAGAIAEYELAASLYRGEFLADDPYEEWPVLTREHLRLTYLDLLDRLSRLHFDQGRYAASAALCRRIIGHDRCREDAHRRLIRCYSRLGQPHLALRQYLACVKALRAELDVDPAPTTIRLQEAVRRHEPV